MVSKYSTTVLILNSLGTISSNVKLGTFTTKHLLNHLTTHTFNDA